MGKHRHGTELIRKKGGGKAFALTAPLITKADGSKFGKSEGDNVWIDKNRTSAYKFYQYRVNSSDEDASKFIRIFTLKSREEIEALEAEHAENPKARILQKALAEDVTRRVHSKKTFKQQLRLLEFYFGKSAKEDLAALPETELLSVFEGVPQCEIESSDLKDGLGIIDLLTDLTGFLDSKGDAKRAIKENSIRVNKEVVGADCTISCADLINGRQLLLQRGKELLVNAK